MASILTPRRSGAGPLAGLARKRSSSIRFGLVGISGLVLNQALLLVLTEVASIYYVVSAVVATVGSSSWNFAGAERWAFAGRRPRSSPGHRYGAFLGLNVALLAARLPILWALTEIIGLHYAWSNVLSLSALFAVRLMVADRWLWPMDSDGHSVEAAIGEAAAARTGRYRYDVAGIASIDSDVVLPELRHFLTAGLDPSDSRPHGDICIRVGFVGARPTRHIKFEQTDDSIVYREHLGPLAANFSIRMGTPIEIRVSPVLAMSPHVVYTNIVEALLRFLLVSRGYVLLHSAAIAHADRVTLLSARTDTGKTSTVISLIRARGYRFLSDDMTIIDSRGYAISYPKPMTLSFHTMGVAKDGRLTKRDRMALSVQSRLHSKSGRTVGRLLGERNVPIMTMNSVVQFLVPPPKHRIDTLFPCAVGGRGRIHNVVLMERGDSSLDPLPLGETVGRLIANTDDAYEFPPFATFAPRIRIGGHDYQALRRMEEQILALAVGEAHRWGLSVPGHEWADVLPSLIEGGVDAEQVPRRVAVPVSAHANDVGVMAPAAFHLPRESGDDTGVVHISEMG